jgi:hypothetical protein
VADRKEKRLNANYQRVSRAAINNGISFFLVSIFFFLIVYFSFPFFLRELENSVANWEGTEK